MPLVRIALDLMGGDDAPVAVIGGARLALERHPDLGLVLLGRPEACRAAAAQLPDRARVELVECDEVITNDEAPSLAARRKKDSSIVAGMRRVKAGGAEAFVSCGPTGALMAAGLFAFGRLPGVRRPALGSPFPNLAEPGRWWMMLDIGATMDAAAADLYTQAVIGSVYSSLVLGVERPRVALLNVGTEPAKGNEVVRAAHQMLEATDLNFIGNVEARDIYAGPADVVVTDGFVGNVLLKGMEGLVYGIGGAIRDQLRSDARGRLGGLIARPHLRRALKRLDYTEYGGAPLFGLAGGCIKCHGASDELAVAGGLGVARDFVAKGVLAAMQGALAEAPPSPAPGGQKN